ncbi:MAG: DUF5060 domain-containing protein, partial [Pseudomonadota bacterium]
FTDARLTVRFERNDERIDLRGYFAADGRAADTGASAGRTWQVRFAPPSPGVWRYRAALRTGPGVALSDDPLAGQPASLTDAQGQIDVRRDPTVAVSATDLRSGGVIRADRGYFIDSTTGEVFLKAGANSPENFLAYAGFDGTYVRRTSSREGEAARDTTLRDFAAHRRDWRDGDPLWRGDRGKGIVGAVNYLADQGMNAVYFLTMNIDGDGNDVWPYATPEDRTRFDVSKLAQWDRLFEHMQARGLMLHMVLQETENERLLDDGDTGPERSLYLLELIARFGHHRALAWNLGEENGPAHWSPVAQDDAQRRAMAAFLARHDPYDHPILLHTHADPDTKTPVLMPLLGFAPLDGLSLQVDAPSHVNADVRRWRQRSRDAGHPWIVSMDEIGPWHTGAAPDSRDPDHDVLRRHVLWGSLLGGATGVEWYFGAHQPGNDLSARDWRAYHRLWQQTRVAIDLLAPFRLTDWSPCNARLASNTYCLGRLDDALVIYAEGGTDIEIDLSDSAFRYTSY